MTINWIKISFEEFKRLSAGMPLVSGGGGADSRNSCSSYIYGADGTSLLRHDSITRGGQPTENTFWRNGDAATPEPPPVPPPPPLPAERCETCRFFREWRCRRYPPQMVYDPLPPPSGGVSYGRGIPQNTVPSDVMPKFPRVASTEWCGERRPVDA